ncbi:MAG: sulfatase [Cellulophaga sp.]
MKMKNSKLIVVLFLGFLLGACNNKKEEIIPPNIIVFMVDDMGWQDTSVPFWDKITPYNKLYKTPNMERLTAEGMKFTQAYATAVCSPTRVSFMTGMNAARHRVTNWTLVKDSMQPMEKNHPTLSFPHWNVNGISQNEFTKFAVHATTLPSVLKQAGYFNIHVGKSHLGAIGTPGADPLNLGFDVNVAGHAAGAPGSYLGKDNFGNGKKGGETWAVPGLEQYYGKDIFLSEALTLEAIKAMDVAITAKKPFFLYMAHYAVHTPIMGDDRFLQKYLDQGLEPVEAKYAALVEGMDKSLGDLMNYLEEKDIDDNTIILFMSDNGGLSAVARGGEKHTHNKPLSSGKGSAHEGGIREPMIVKWPGKVKENTVSNDYLIIEDFYPTILEMAGIHSPEIVQKIDGISFMPLLKEEPIEGERSLFWHYPNEWGPSGPGIGASSAVRRGDWKFIYYHVDQRMELFNLKEDIGEANNLLESNTDKAKEMAIILSDYLFNVDAQMPTYKETGIQVPMPIEVL